MTAENDIERQIAEKLVRAAISSGFLITVDDGGALPIKRSSNAELILAAMFSSDGDTLIIRKPDGDRVGCIALIYGNGADVIADHTDNAVIGELVRLGNAND